MRGCSIAPTGASRSRRPAWWRSTTPSASSRCPPRSNARLKEVSGQEVGPLLIGASTTIAEFLLPKILGEFKARYPGIVPQLERRELGGRAGAGRRSAASTSGSSKATRICRRSITDVCCEDELQVVCAPSHPFAQREAVPLQALTEHAYIGRELGSGTREVDRPLPAEGAAFRSTRCRCHGSEQSGGAQGTGGDRARASRSCRARRRKRRCASASSCRFRSRRRSFATVRRLSEGAYPLEGRQRLRSLREGKARCEARA